MISLATTVKNNIPGSEVRILDGQLLSKEEIVAEIKDFSPDFVGISSTETNYPFALELARLVKYSGSRVLFGGHHASSLAKEIMFNRGPRSQDPCIDAVVCGDGEEALWRAASGDDFRRISNVVWQDEDGRVVANEMKSLDIDKTAFLDRDFVNLEEYFRRQGEPQRPNGFKRGMTIVSRKGCAWKSRSGGCIFCNRMNKEISNIKNPELFWREVGWLAGRYNIDFLWDVRDDFMEDKNWLENLAASRPSLDKLGRNFRFKIYARIDNINDETAALLEKLNLPMRITIGFETGSDRMLKTMNKGYSMEQVWRGLESLKKLDSRFTACFVLGCLGESAETLSETIDFAQKLSRMGANIFPQILRPSPNSRAFDLIAKKKEPKYANQDLINTQELVKDWVADFCDVGLDDLLDAYQKMKMIAGRNSTA
jgi:radical SAM superfamily enzyme YgiQ (UPF0313 family)